MFDNLGFVIENFRKKDFDCLIQNHVKNSPRNRGDWFQADWSNLRINYFPTYEKLKIQNSIHKFFSDKILSVGSVNHTDFSKNDVAETVAFLENACCRNSSEMKLVGRFEYGLNINTYDLKPFSIIDKYQSIVTTATNPFYAFYNKSGKPYAKFCPFTNYKVKAYDKGKEQQLSNRNILRYEMVHHNVLKTRQVFKKSDPNLFDLLNIEIWETCFENLLNSYNSIRMLSFPDDGVENYAKTLCYSLPAIRKDYKSHLRKFGTELKNAHEVMKKSPDNPHFVVTNGLVTGFQKLIST